MRRKSRIALMGAGVALFGVIAISASYKPARILMPELFGLTCPTKDICVEDLSTLADATKLRMDGIAFVEKELGALEIPGLRR